MDLLVPLSKQIKLAVALPDRIPVRLSEFSASAIDYLDGGQIRHTDFSWTCSYEGTVFGMQIDHGVVDVAIP